MITRTVTWILFMGNHWRKIRFCSSILNCLKTFKRRFTEADEKGASIVKTGGYECIYIYISAWDTMGMTIAIFLSWKNQEQINTLTCWSRISTWFIVTRRFLFENLAFEVRDLRPSNIIGTRLGEVEIRIQLQEIICYPVFYSVQTGI